MAELPRRPLNDIGFEKTDGGLGRTTGKRDDAISALLFGGDGNRQLFEDMTIGHPSRYRFDILVEDKVLAARLDSQDGLAGIGIIRTEPGEGSGHDGALSEKEATANTLHYHITEYFRLNDGAGPLYVGVFNVDENVDIAIAAIQRYADGRIRQAGVIMDDVCSYSKKIVAACKDMEDSHMPLSVVGTGMKLCKVETLEGLADNVLTAKQDVSGSSHSCNLSLLVGCDLDATLAAGLTDGNGENRAILGCVGACIGAVSKAKVHESIAWVGQFPLGLKEPGVGVTAMRNVTTEAMEQLNGCRAIFVRTHVGVADNYFNDSHTLAPETSDYAYIENVRTIDKACRGVRSKLLPYLNGPLSVDASTGKLSADTAAFLETKAGEAVEEMEKAGELCGYKVTIDPDQNVLATSEVEVVIQNVPMGVMRKVNVKIGFTTQV